ncbi:hypothetical protein [Mesotoga sp.]|uniref:hypothetical protein n=1 Tax=Mesotoga sp. TaxID=2053577 RepID=UPI00345EC4FA
MLLLSKKERIEEVQVVVVMVMISIVFMLTGCPKVKIITYTSLSDGSTEAKWV